MRYRDIIPPKSHPYLVTIRIDPADLRRLQRRVEDRPELKLLDYDDSEPDLWPVRVACASREVASRFEDAWS